MSMVKIFSVIIIGITLFHLFIKVKNYIFISATIIAVAMTSYWYLYVNDSVQIIK